MSNADADPISKNVRLMRNNSLALMINHCYRIGVGHLNSIPGHLQTVLLIFSSLHHDL